MKTKSQALAIAAHPDPIRTPSRSEPGWTHFHSTKQVIAMPSGITDQPIWAAGTNAKKASPSR